MNVASSFGIPEEELRCRLLNIPTSCFLIVEVCKSLKWVSDIVLAAPEFKHWARLGHGFSIYLTMVYQRYLRLVIDLEVERQ